MRNDTFFNKGTSLSATSFGKKQVVKALGIDFGSSKTCVVGILEKSISVPGENKPVIFTNNAETTYKTAIAKDKNDGLHFFDQAYILPPARTACIYDNLKEDVSRQRHLEWVENFFRELSDKLENSKFDDYVQYDFSQLECICFGHPAYYIPTSIEEYTEQIKKIIGKTIGRRLSEDKIIALPEPILAAYAFNHANCKSEKYVSAIEDNDNILILDFGGHTLDIAVATAKKDSAGITLTPHYGSGSISAVLPMGKTITGYLCQEIYDEDDTVFDPAVEDAKCQFFSHPIDNNRGESHTLGRLHKNPQIKEFTLCYNEMGEYMEGNTVHVGLASGKHSIKLETMFERFINHIKGYINDEKAGIEAKSIKHVLFTGGTSKIEPLRGKIINGIKSTVAKDRLSVMVMDIPFPSASQDVILRSDNRLPVALSSSSAVALGAALAASGAVGFKSSFQRKRAGLSEGEKSQYDQLKRDFTTTKMLLLDTKKQLDKALRIIDKYPQAKAEYMRKK